MKQVKKIGIFFAAVLLLVAGLGCFAGCADSAPTEETALGMVTLDTWMFTSGVPNNQITVAAEEEGVVFVCRAKNGEFWDVAMQEYAKEVELASGGKTYWSGDAIEEDRVEIFAKKEGEIVGYAVVAVAAGEGMNYEAEVLHAAYFVDEEGQRCSASERTVQQLMDKFA